MAFFGYFLLPQKSSQNHKYIYKLQLGLQQLTNYNQIFFLKSAINLTNDYSCLCTVSVHREPFCKKKKKKCICYCSDVGGWSDLFFLKCTFFAILKVPNKVALICTLQ